jgi:hypothetical protein
MKLKDFFTKLKTDGKITQAEFVAAIETLPEFEFPDKAIEAFEDSFLTPDRAITDKRVNSKIRREILDPADKELNELIDYHLKDYVHMDKREAFKKEESTYNKLKSLSGILGESFKRVQVPSSDEEIKKKMKTVEETNQELLQRIEKMNSDYSSKEKQWESTAQEKIDGYRLISELEKRANSFKFGKAFSDDSVRKDITKVKLDGLRAKHALKLVDKDGQTEIQVTDKEGKPLFNGNSAITINQLLEDEFKPYIKANNSGDDDTDEPEPRDTKRFTVQDGKKEIRQGRRTTVS